MSLCLTTYCIHIKLDLRVVNGRVLLSLDVPKFRTNMLPHPKGNDVTDYAVA